MRKILFDTDIGSDIDDAVCLAYLLAHPECELLGITTVSGEANLRAEMADAMCKNAGKNIPVFPGVEKPLLGNSKQPKAPQAAALGGRPREKNFKQNEAINFMRDTIRANPGEVDLLAVGPMTNVGLLFANDPEIPSLLNSLWLMCGVFKRRHGFVGLLEWNALNDPAATAITYEARPKVHRSVGLDATCLCVMNAKEVRERFSKCEILAPVSDFAEVWFRHSETLTFHDPLTAACLFNENICKFSRGKVDVELCGERLAGLTHWTDDANGPHEAALEVSPEAFFDEYFRVVENA